jgi:hypothetical protein
MQKNSRRIFSVSLLLVLLIVAIQSIVTSVSACNNRSELPASFDVIYYSRGSANVEVPSGWPAGGVPTTMLRIVATQIEAGSLGKAKTIFIYSYNPSSSIGPWIPVAIFTTNDNALLFYRTVWSGTPAAASTNSRVLSESVFNVQRCGNRIIAELTEPQSIMWSKAVTPPPFTYVTIPAFKIELYNVGGCVLTKTSSTLTGYTGSSGYTINDYQLSFNARGAFICQTWGYNAKPMTDCEIVMHGIRTYTLP